MTGNLKLFELKKLEDTRMKIVIINGSARKGNTLTAINAFIKGASEKNEIEIIEPDKLNIAPCNCRRDYSQGIDLCLNEGDEVVDCDLIIV